MFIIGIFLLSVKMLKKNIEIMSEVTIRFKEIVSFVVTVKCVVQFVLKHLATFRYSVY